MIYKNIKNNSGFIALMSSILVSVILLLIAANLSSTSFYSRSDILDSELKERSLGLAEACVDNAILSLAKTPLYTGNTTITIKTGETCTLSTINPNTDPIIVNTKAVFGQATTNLQVKLKKSDLSVYSWEELP